MSQPPPPIEGIIETILYVDDLPRAVAFYRDVLGLTPMTGDPVRFQAFKIGGRQALLLFKRGSTLEPTTVPGGVIPPHDGHGPQHIGFAVTHEAYDAWLARLRARAIAVESETHWPRGGRSLYFRDPDGHLLELITPGIWPNY
ncbi:MAG: VOC family protein [Opitutae bacterium]|nr:VOC family protein [Opitutae bacterium]